ncbi:MAG TPA: DUF4345 domain-containing protein [Cytophagales bacterium]|nr:DUF4345 domain-containing protein [Cytophagales bacterium]
MEKSRLVQAFLIISGIIATGIGGALLIAPVAFEASAGIDLGENINLLSEVRAPGGTLSVAGILITTGAFISGITHFSILLSCLFYLSYGLSRVLGMMIDGIPNESLVMATVAEILIGLLSLLLVFRIRRKQYPTS